MAMITTIDNPYNPFDDFDLWFLYDAQKGYNTCDYLSRIARTSESLSEEDNNQIINDAIDEIIKYDFMNIYKKVEKSVPDETDYD